MPQFFRCAIIIILAPLLGCGGETDLPEIGTVSGIVTLDGEPLPNARVYYSPVEGGQTSDAVTDEQGRYELRYKRDIMGAKIGEHRVTVTTYEPPTLDDLAKPVGGREELVPEKYNTATTLTVAVEPGANDIPLTLTE